MHPAADDVAYRDRACDIRLAAIAVQVGPYWWSTISSAHAWTTKAQRPAYADPKRRWTAATRRLTRLLSAAYKYVCMEVFCIPTEGMPDADKTTHEVASPYNEDQQAIVARSWLQKPLDIN